MPRRRNRNSRPDPFLSQFGGGGGFTIPGFPGGVGGFNTLTGQQQDKLRALKQKKRGEGLNKRERRRLKRLKSAKNQFKNIDLRTPGGALQGQLGANLFGLGLQQQFNRPDQFGPFGGSRQFEIDPETGQQVVRDSLGGAGQQTLEGLQGLAPGALGQAGQALQQGLDFGGQAPLPEDFAGQRAQIEKDLFNRFNELNDPTFQQQRQDLETSLSQRGIPVGSELFNAQVGELEENQNRARERARTEATTFAQQEQDRLFNSALQSRQQGIGEQLTQRGQPLQELGSLLALQQGIPQSQFGPIAQLGVPGLDVGGTALGFANLFGGQNLAQQQMAQQAALAGQAIGARPDPFALANQRNELAKDFFSFQQGFNQPQQNFNPSLGQQLAGGVGGGLGTGLGFGLGDFVGGLFGG